MAKTKSKLQQAFDTLSAFGQRVKADTSKYRRPDALVRRANKFLSTKPTVTPEVAFKLQKAEGKARKGSLADYADTKALVKRAEKSVSTVKEKIAPRVQPPKVQPVKPVPEKPPVSRETPQAAKPTYTDTVKPLESYKTQPGKNQELAYYLDVERHVDNIPLAEAYGVARDVIAEYRNQNGRDFQRAVCKFFVAIMLEDGSIYKQWISGDMSAIDSAVASLRGKVKAKESRPRSTGSDGVIVWVEIVGVRLSERQKLFQV